MHRREFLRTVSAVAVGSTGVIGSVDAVAGDTSSERSSEANRTGITTTNSFQQVAKLTAATDGSKNDTFGKSVAVSGDGKRALVGAKNDDPQGTDSGSAYIFEFSGGSWTQQQRLTPTDGDRGDVFGHSVALSDDGTTAVVGAKGDENGLSNATNAGSAYVFELSNGSWQEQEKLIPKEGDIDDGDKFGWSVALSKQGTTALVGAPVDENASATTTGTAYVFSYSNGSWQQEQKLIATDSGDGDEFGYSVALSHDGATAVIGANEQDQNDFQAGAAYVFTKSSGSWTEQQKLTPTDGDKEDRFGHAVALSGDGTTALFGAINDEGPDNVTGTPGSAYVFESANGSWQQQRKLLPGDAGDAGSEKFGSAVALSADGTTAVIGAQAGQNETNYTGRGYVFEFSNGSWGQKQKIAANDRDTDDKFGNAAALSGDGKTAIVGARDDEDPHGDFAGSAYVFESQSTNSTPTADAGPDQTVTEQTSVTLDGSASSDPDGDSLSYTWRQTGGPSVSLSDASTATPTFTAPDVGVDTDLTFELTVDDGSTTATDSTLVTVSASSTPLAVKRLSLKNEAAGKSTATVPSGELVQGETVEFVATVENTGSSAVSDAVSLSFGAVVSETVSVNSLAAGAQTEVYATVRVGTISPGSYTLTAGAGGSSRQMSVRVRRLGDINHDGSVGPGDATKVQKRIVGISPSGNYNPVAGDTKPDGTVGPGDVTRIQKIIVGLFSPETDLNLDTTVKTTGTR